MITDHTVILVATPVTTTIQAQSSSGPAATIDPTHDSTVVKIVSTERLRSSLREQDTYLMFISAAGSRLSAVTGASTSTRA